MSHFETAHRNEVDVSVYRKKDRAADVNFDQFGVGVRAMEIGPDCGGFFAYLSVPHVLRPDRIGQINAGLRPSICGCLALFRRAHLIDTAYLIKAAPIEIDIAQMLRRFTLERKQPIAFDFMRERVEITEK